MNIYNMARECKRFADSRDIRHIANWAALYGVPCGIVANYCRNLGPKDKLPRGAKRYEKALRKKIMERIGLKAVTEKLAYQSVRPAPDLDAMVEASLSGEHKAEWSGPY